MTREEYKKAIEGVVWLVGCAADGRIPERERLEAYDVHDLYTAAGSHMLAAAAGLALQSAGVEDAEFKAAVAASYRKTVILDAERKIVFQKLDEAGIWHMPLKGTVLKDWYPKFGMREMVDCDVLIDASREEDVRDIMVSLGFTVEAYGGGHHGVYHKLPISSFEIHPRLFGPAYEQRFNDYYDGVLDRLIRHNGYEFRFSPEDFYIFMVAHEYRHYSRGGVGLRSLLDVCVILKKLSDSLDWQYVETELSKLELTDFEEKNRLLAIRLFSGEPLAEAEREMLDYMIFSGTHGTVTNLVTNRVNRFGGGIGGKVKYTLTRIFLPMDTVKRIYPFFYRHKLLLPVLPIYRLIVNRRKSSWRQEWKTLRSSDSSAAPR